MKKSNLKNKLEIAVTAATLIVGAYTIMYYITLCAGILIDKIISKLNKTKGGNQDA